MTGQADRAFGQAVQPAQRPLLLGLGFLAGFLSVLSVHQGAIELFHLAGWFPNPAYPMQPVPPLGVPRVLSLAFWGGVWGVAFTLLIAFVPYLPRRGAGLVIAGIVFGAVVINGFNWLVLAPLAGQKLGNGFVLANMLRSMLINGIYGLGAGSWLAVGRHLAARRGSTTLNS